MDLKTLQENHPDLYQQVIAMGVEQGKQEMAKAVDEARQTSAVTERERITTLLNAGADQKATMEAINGGMTAGEAYKSFFEAEKNKRGTALADLGAQATKPVKAEEPAAAVAGDDVKKFETAVQREMATGKTRGQAVLAVSAAAPELHEQYLKALNSNKPADK